MLLAMSVIWGYWTDIKLASNFVPGFISFTDIHGRTLAHVSKGFGLKKCQRNLYSLMGKLISRCCIYYQWTFFINGVDDGMQSTFSKSTGVPKCGKRAYAARLLLPATLTGCRDGLAGTSGSFNKGACEVLHLG